jgi:threonine dehydrogenase-like Zn-dependent dehydrogenase
MKAARLSAHGGLRIEDVPKPEPAQGDALVQVEVALVDGADLRRFRQTGDLAAPFGREFCGYLDGRRVVAAAGSLSGACADWVLVPAEIATTNLLDVPIGLSSDVAALVGPLACCLRGVGAANIAAGETVAVLGGGPLGLLLAACVVDAGGRAVVVGGQATYQELAVGFGAEIGDGRGADAVIEAGEIEPSSFPDTTASVRAALGFLASGAYPWGQLITHRVLLADLPTLLVDPPDDLLKAAVVP